MKEIILVKVGELALKGLNRRTFEDALVKNIRRGLDGVGEYSIQNAQSTLYIVPESEKEDLDEAIGRVKKVFGIAALSRACVAGKEMNDILRTAAEYLAPSLEEVLTFKVEAKRSDKKFPLRSPEICAQTGEFLL